MPFDFETTPISGLIVVKPKVFGDERGFFMEAFVKRDFESAGIKMDVLQINHSRSAKGVLRGSISKRIHSNKQGSLGVSGEK